MPQFPLSRRSFVAGLAALPSLVVLPALPPRVPAARAAAGYYGVELRDGRWWFVTPQGASFYSIGLDYVNPVGMVAVDNSDPYSSVMRAKYGNPVNHAAWATDVGARLVSWGFNTVGAYSSGAGGTLAGLPDTPTLFPLLIGAIPAMRQLNGGGDTYPILVVSPNDTYDFHRRFVDVYHPAFATGADRYLAARLPARAADPTLLGYFLDNELPFFFRRADNFQATSATTPGALTLADSYIALEGATYAKQRWVALLRRRYFNDISLLNDYWASNYTSFDALLGVDVVPGSNAPRCADKSAFLTDITETYFRTYRDIFRRYDPNHLLLGCRFVAVDGIDTPREILRAAGWYQDVVSINYYIFASESSAQRRARVRARYATFAAATGRPILNGETSFGARDSGLPSTRPLGELVNTQAERAQRYQDLARFTAELSGAVGLHWWAYVEPPPQGAANGGEDSNVGLVNSADIPYAVMTDAMANFHPQLPGIHAEAPKIGVFPDVPGGTAEALAIAELAARGIIKGYPDGHFGPGDHTLRAQMAALIARGMGWDTEDWGNDFQDQGSLNANLWRNTGTLARYRVALGYGTTRFGPNDKVTYAQTISFVTRAMVFKGYWKQQPGAPQLHTGVPPVHDADIRTYAFYTGGIPKPPATRVDWDAPARRDWFALALWTALAAYHRTV